MTEILKTVINTDDPNDPMVEFWYYDRFLEAETNIAYSLEGIPEDQWELTIAAMRRGAVTHISVADSLMGLPKPPLEKRGRPRGKPRDKANQKESPGNNFTFRLSPSERNKLLKLGGGQWIRQQINSAWL